MGAKQFYSDHHPCIWDFDVGFAQRIVGWRSRRVGIGLLYWGLLDFANPCRRILFFPWRLAEGETVRPRTFSADLVISVSGSKLFGAVRLASMGLNTAAKTGC